MACLTFFFHCNRIEGNWDLTSGAKCYSIDLFVDFALVNTCKFFIVLCSDMADQCSFQHLHRYRFGHFAYSHYLDFEDEAPHSCVPYCYLELGLSVRIPVDLYVALVLIYCDRAVVAGVVKAVYQIGFAGEMDSQL